MYIKTKKRPDPKECKKLLKTMSIKELALHVGYHEASLRRWLKERSIKSPRKQGQKVKRCTKPKK